MIYYVIMDDDGVYITTSPDIDDVIVLKTTSLYEAEVELSRCSQGVMS